MPRSAPESEERDALRLDLAALRARIRNGPPLPDRTTSCAAAASANIGTGRTLGLAPVSAFAGGSFSCRSSRLAPTQGRGGTRQRARAPLLDRGGRATR